jgi:hypothetical protein
MSAKQHWAWFLLVLLCLVVLGWTRRYEYAACDTDGCVAIDRWTGSITFRETGWAEDPPEPENQVASARSTRGGAGY